MACREMIAAALLALSMAAWPAAAQQAAEPSAAAAPGEALKDGILNRLEHALTAMEEKHRTRAVVALDEAHRLLGVAVHLEEGAGLYDATELRVGEVRRLIQNGRPGKAGKRLRDTAAAFAAAPALEVAAPAGLARHGGATLLNAHGKVVGELALTPGGEPLAMVGDWRDAFGMLDLDGTAVALPAGMLIPGPLRTLGRTFVVVATPADQKALVERARVE